MSDTQARDLTFVQGFDFVDTLQIVKDGIVQPLTGATLTFRLRPVGLTADTYTVGLSVDAPTNTATLHVPASAIGALTAYGVYTYDVRLVDTTGAPSRPAYGRVFVQPERI